MENDTGTLGKLENALPPLLTTPQAAALANAGERTLWRWSRSGICPEPIKIGPGKQGAVRYRRDELLEWIRSGCPRCDGEHGR
jgi:predicted DNA-binding transcriptional regulator AlpA